MKRSWVNKVYCLGLILGLALGDAGISRAEDWQFVGEKAGRGKIYVDKDSISPQPAGTTRYRAKIYVEGERKASLAKAIAIQTGDPGKGQALDHVICEIEVDCAKNQDRLLSMRFLNKRGKELAVNQEPGQFVDIGPDDLSQAIKALVCGPK